MRTSISNLNGVQQNALSHLSKNLKRSINPLMIICYGHRSSTTFQSSAFSNSGVEKRSSSVFDLFILISNDEVLPDSSILEIARRNCIEGNAANIIVFRMGHVLLALQNKNRFFSGIFRSGILLYGDKDAMKMLPHPLPPVCFVNRSEKEGLKSLLQHAQQCLAKVEQGLQDGYYDPQLNIILLNESCVYITRYYIAAYWGIEMHGDLKKLLNFTLNINSVLADLFPCNTMEESILFHVINLSFIDEGFCPGPVILETLTKRVGKMIAVSQGGAQKKIAQLLTAD